MLNLIGQIFGQRKVLGLAYKRNHKCYWQVECSCGKISAIITNRLRRGSANRCKACSGKLAGLLKTKNALIPVGTVIGKRTVVENIKTVGQVSQARVRCVCGQEDIVDQCVLKRGRANQCQGCASQLIGDRATKHGHTKNGKRLPTYTSWASMCQRCLDPNFNDWHKYGGRGIKISDRWRGKNGFKTFLADLGERPEGTTLDRIDGAGDYVPENCRWSTQEEQIKNRRKYQTLDKFTTEELIVELQRRGIK